MNPAEQVEPQSIPAGSEVTVPVPSPPLVTVRLFGGLTGAPSLMRDIIVKDLAYWAEAAKTAGVKAE